MVDLTDIEIGETYVFKIKQSDEVYEAIIQISTPMNTDTDTAGGQVRSSTYPNDGWEGKRFRINRDGTVDMPRDPFGPIGEVVEYEIQ